MIVSCPACGAKYQYDEARFGGSTTKRLKCSKCDGTFEVTRPEGSRVATGQHTVVAGTKKLEETTKELDLRAIGAATDPYQPAEGSFRITRQCLEVLARASHPCSITTKGTLIVRDLDLLRAINERSRLSVNFSLITLSRRLQRTLEPRAPRPRRCSRSTGRRCRQPRARPWTCRPWRRPGQPGSASS